MGPESALTTRAASLLLVLEGLLVIVVLAITVMGAQLPSSHPLGRVEPAAVLIALTWLAGVWLISRARRGLPWHDVSGTAPGAQEKPRGHSKAATAKKMGLTRAATLFILGATVTLGAGIVLERSGAEIAGHVGLSGVIFGATILAAATALPEVSTGIAAVRLGDYQLAVSDIFGGNAFLPVLFLLASVLSGSAVLPQAQPTDIYLTELGIVLTSVYLWGLITRPHRQVLRMGHGLVDRARGLRRRNRRAHRCDQPLTLEWTCVILGRVHPRGKPHDSGWVGRRLPPTSAAGGEVRTRCGVPRVGWAVWPLRDGP